MGVFLLTISCLLLYLGLKAKGQLSLSNAFRYQEIVYRFGFNNIPLPKTAHPWMIILGIYGFGIVSSLFVQFFRTKSKINEVVAFLSVMGIGLFSYYQYRAHEYNLPVVIWPAVFIVLTLADRTIRSVKQGIVTKSALLPVAAAVLVPVMLFASYLDKLPDLIKLGNSRYKQLISHGESMAEENMKFVATHVENAKSAVILSINQSSYFADLGLVSAINGPGIWGTILKADIDSFFRQVSEKHISKIFICLRKDGSLPPDYNYFAPLFEKYKIGASVDIDPRKSPARDFYMNMLVPLGEKK